MCKSHYQIFSRDAGASKIELVLSEKDDYVYLFIADNGKGFNTEETKKVSYGLKNMRERTEEIGGIFTLRSHPGKGRILKFACQSKGSKFNLFIIFVERDNGTVGN